MERHLVLVRHATAEEKSLSSIDADRALTGQGRNQAKIAARALRDYGVPEPDWVVTSGYKRAEQTLAAFVLPKDVRTVQNAVFSPYGDAKEAAGVLVSLLRERAGAGEGPGPHGRVVWVVGHSPSLEHLLESFSERIFSSVKSLQKCAVIWVSWDGDFEPGVDEPRLRGYLPKPRP